MKAIYKIRGTIYKIDFEELKEVIYYLFGFCNVKVKIRIIGEQMTYVDDEIEFHGESRYEEDNISSQFYIDISCYSGLHKTIDLINKFELIFKKNNLIYDLEYVQEEDETGKLLGDEVVFRHPNYDEFMKKNSGG